MHHHHPSRTGPCPSCMHGQSLVRRRLRRMLIIHPRSTASNALTPQLRRLRRCYLTRAQEVDTQEPTSTRPLESENNTHVFIHIQVVSYKSRLRSQKPNQGRAPGPSIHPPIRFDHRSHNPGNRPCGEQPTEPPNCLASLQSHTVVCWCRLTSPSPPTTWCRRRTAAARAPWCSHTVESLFHPPSLASQDAIPMLDSLFLENKTRRPSSSLVDVRSNMHTAFLLHSDLVN
ncbi:hypothetical protein LZ32DRAFT_195357 [Colletotrichum eremochloae]|nr:hypothetical protein LZ32DRAFT_195357 [Colletotrichum eremochloae]